MKRYQYKQADRALDKDHEPVAQAQIETWVVTIDEVMLRTRHELLNAILWVHAAFDGETNIGLLQARAALLEAFKAVRARRPEAARLLRDLSS